MTRCMAALWLRAYACLLRLYPADFRSLYAEEMLAVFTAATGEAARHGIRAMAELGWRELRDLPASLWREHLSGLRKANDMTRRVQPHSWYETALSAVPGLLIAGGYWLALLLDTGKVTWATPLTWAMGGLWCLLAIGLSLRRRQAVLWGLPATGVLVSLLPALLRNPVGNAALPLIPLGVAGLAFGLVAVALWRHVGLPRLAWLLLGMMVALGLSGAWLSLARSSLGPDPAGYAAFVVLYHLFPTALVILLLVAGLPPARAHGAKAVLLLLGSLPLFIDMMLDPTYGIRSSPLRTVALMAPILRSLLAGSLLVVAPAWVLRARTPRAQWLGALVPLLPVAVAVVAMPLWSGYVSVPSILPDVAVLAQFILGVVAALAVYGRRQRGEDVLPRSAFRGDGG